MTGATPSLLICVRRVLTNRRLCSLPATRRLRRSSDLEDAQGACQKLEELLGKEQEWGATRTEMCSPGAPEIRNCRT